MSLLDTPMPVPPAQQRANRAIALPRRLLEQLLRSWAAGLDLVWNPHAPTTTAQVLAALGTNAGELFTRSAALRAFLEAQKPGCTNIPQAGRVKEVTIHGDGTVSLKS
ncbi:MAG: hypothetical protein ABSE62_16560 [Chthoniobacteraceae bacterium]|jgi:hypothetical protein